MSKLNYLTKEKTFIDITDVDRSEAKYAVSAVYYKIDPTKITLEEWISKSLEFDPDVDFTYWEFNRDIEGKLKKKFESTNKDFTQSKYVITNRRVVHAFMDDPYFHRAGFHTRPRTILDFLRSLYKPDFIKFHKGNDKTPDTYQIRNTARKTQSFLNVHDNKYLKIQTSYLREDVEYILSISEVYSSDLSEFNQDRVINESYLLPLQDKYLMIEKMLYTFNPEVLAMDDTIDGRTTKSLRLSNDQIDIMVENFNFITEELNCDYLLDGRILTISSKGGVSNE